MTNEQALVIFDKSEKCNGEPCPEGLNCNICPYNVTDEEFDEAYETAKNALSKHCASSEQADTKLFNRGYWLMPGEVFISHNVLNEVLNTIIKSINTEQRKIDSTLVKTAENDEAIRTDDHIADSDKKVDQFRDDTKKTDDVPDTNVGKTDFKPGDKFILELGQERRMFDEFEIAGTDLYVETRLLEKLTRYEPEEKTEKIPYKKPEIICCKDCRYRDPEDKKCDHGHGIVWQLPRSDDWFCADGKA